MTQAEKTLARADSIIGQGLEKLRAKHREAEGNYRDTGYTRYYTAMEKLEAQIDQLEGYRNGSHSARLTEGELNRLHLACRDYQQKLAEMAKELPQGSEERWIVERCSTWFAIIVEPYM